MKLILRSVVMALVSGADLHEERMAELKAKKEALQARAEEGGERLFILVCTKVANVSM